MIIGGLRLREIAERREGTSRKYKDDYQSIRVMSRYIHGENFFHLTSFSYYTLTARPLPCLVLLVIFAVYFL